MTVRSPTIDQLAHGRLGAMRQRLERGEPVVPMYGPLGLAWLQRQAEIAEQLIAARTGEPPPA